MFPFPPPLRAAVAGDTTHVRLTVLTLATGDARRSTCTIVANFIIMARGDPVRYKRRHKRNSEIKVAPRRGAEATQMVDEGTCWVSKDKGKGRRRRKEKKRREEKKRGEKQ